LTRRNPFPPVLWVLLAVLSFRMFSFLVHEPMWGYGNNYDQVRYTGCVGVFPHRPGVDPGLYSPEAPLELFSRQPAVEAPCLWTSELVFVGAFAAGLASEEAKGEDGIGSVRTVGIARAMLLFMMLATLVEVLVRRREFAVAIGLAAAAAAVLADPAMLLWANTFYAEFTSIIAAVASVGVLLLAWSGARSIGLAAAMVVAAVALALGKVQYGPLPLALALGFALATWGGAAALRAARLRALVPFAFAAVVGLAAQLVSISRTDDPALPLWQKVGTFNFVFNGVLGSSADPVRTTKRLELPDACATLASKTIFDYAAREEWEAACPEAFALTRAGVLARILAQEPATLMRLLGRAFIALDPWVQNELGHVAGESYGDVTRERASLGTLLGDWRALSLAVVIAPLAWIVLALAVPRWRAAGGHAWLAAWLANAIIWQQLLLTAVGDGVHDLSRQAFLVYAAALAWIVGCAAAWAGRRLPRWATGPDEGALRL